MLAETAGPGGLAILAVLVLLISGVLTLGRETKREREIADKVLTPIEKIADQVERVLDFVSRNGAPR